MDKKGKFSTDVSLYLVFVFGGFLLASRFLPAALSLWEDIARGHISGNWLIIARAGDPFWYVVIFIAIILTAFAIGGMVLLVFGVFKIIKDMQNKNKSSKGD